MFFRTPQMLLESAKYPSLRVAVLAFTNLPITFDFLVLSLILPFDAKLASLLILEESDGELMDGEHDGDSSPVVCTTQSSSSCARDMAHAACTATTLQRSCNAAGYVGQLL
mmetsp:Transcript_7428/g.17666  ORF Transcript_7428/g.17666 Transcript_7428/m.17666 type:complete len:111 (+) Transcript_7428:2054-2386(+)